MAKKYGEKTGIGIAFSSLRKLKKEEIEEETEMAGRGSQGMTLVELILCLAVLAVLLTIASPLIGQVTSGYRLRAAARELATDLQFARLLAVKENNNFQVVFGSHSYQVVRPSDGFVAKARDFSVDFPEVSLNAPVITFNSRGNSSSQTVTVSNSATSKNITVGSTGRVKLQ